MQQKAMQQKPLDQLAQSPDQLPGQSPDQPAGQPTPQIVRTAPINPCHWYVVARSSEVSSQPLGVVLWHQPVVLFRDSSGQIQALEDRCPHRQVKLSHGKVIGDKLECAYHGWCFDGSGECVEVPYLGERQKRPTAKLKRYSVIEQDGFVWLFPGEGNPAPQQ
ncbi:MAG: Rieske 2Fe-2S domain-containing protein, partial [Elainella sp.]